MPCLIGFVVRLILICTLAVVCRLSASPYLTAALAILAAPCAVSYIPIAVPSLGTSPRPARKVALLSRPNSRLALFN